MEDVSNIFSFNENRNVELMKTASSNHALSVVIDNNVEEVETYEKTITEQNPFGMLKYQPTQISVSLHSPMEPANIRSKSFEIPLG